MQVRQRRGINIDPATLLVNMRSVNMTAMTSLAAQHQVSLLIQFSDEILHTFEKILEIGFHLGFLTNSHFNFALHFHTRHCSDWLCCHLVKSETKTNRDSLARIH